jgi:hypothetical protein
LKLCAVERVQTALWIALGGWGDSPQAGNTPSQQADFTLSRLHLTPSATCFSTLLAPTGVREQMKGLGTLEERNKNGLQDGWCALSTAPLF